MGLFVRKVRTASGATAVQIASKTRGVRTIVEHLGSAHEDEQLVVLIAIARERIAELAGQVPFDLDGLGATPPKDWITCQKDWITWCAGVQSEIR